MFAGLTVPINKNEIVEFGDVPVQVWYGIVELFIQEKNGKKLYKELKDWSKAIIVFRDHNDNHVKTASLSTDDLEKTVNYKKGSLRLAISEGEWTLELIPDWESLNYETGKTTNSLGKVKFTVKRDSFQLLRLKTR